MGPDELFRNALGLVHRLKEINVEPTAVVLKRNHFERLKAYCVQHGYAPFHTSGTENSVLGIKIIIEDDPRQP